MSNSISDAEKSFVDRVLANAWANSTASRYSAAVKDYLAFCDSRHKSASDALPATEELLCLYAASMASAKAGFTTSGKILGLHTWHVQNNIAWPGGTRLKYVLKAIENLRLPESFQPERPPVSTEMLEHLSTVLTLSDPLDACVWAIATTSMWSQIRMGEILPKTEKAYDKSLFPCWSNFRLPNVSGSRSLYLPHTKKEGKKGETVIVTRQDHLCDLIDALANHVLVNKCGAKDALAEYLVPDGRHVPLVLRKFLG
ncbi:hypothetical protein C0992_003682 [Termitomyces sp. T32_za158]|nr:hypothetical protein C0992_003682 [Termitomyces sp. T32_za158]